MSNSDMATCIICGKKYKTCLSCRDQDVIKPWRNIVDTATCYKIFLILSQYNNKHITKEEAQKQLSDVRYNVNDFKKSVQDKISEIISTSASTKKATAKVNIDK